MKGPGQPDEEEEQREQRDRLGEWGMGGVTHTGSLPSALSACLPPGPLLSAECCGEGSPSHEARTPVMPLMANRVAAFS